MAFFAARPMSAMIPIATRMPSLQFRVLKEHRSRAEPRFAFLFRNGALAGTASGI
jgi:hypothetical protein